MKKTFIGYKDRIDYTEEMSFEEMWMLFNAILCYQNWKEIWELWNVKFVWSRIKKELDVDKEKYEKICEWNSEKWKKHKWNQYTKRDSNWKAQKNIVEQMEQNGTNGTHSDSDSVYTSNDVYEEIWDNKLSHKEKKFDELYNNFYWINKWADRNKCDKLIKQLLSNWVLMEDLLSDELLYKAECQIKWERRYVKKFETWLKEYNPPTTEQRDNAIKQILVMYYNKKKEDDKFEQSERNPWNMLCERFWEKNIARMYFEVKPKKTINLVFN